MNIKSILFFNKIVLIVITLLISILHLKADIHHPVIFIHGRQVPADINIIDRYSLDYWA